MKPVAALAILTIAAPVVQSAACTYETVDSNNLVRRYYVGAGIGNGNDIPGRCGGLWDNLKRFGVCLAPSYTFCGWGGNSPDHLHWQFDVIHDCNTGMIESTWWEATRNQFGAINCTPR